jgi:MFS family permease
MLPFANNCLDYLTRINIPDEKQGRAWGLIGFLSQLGYVVAYGLSGILADGISASMNISVGRGSAYAVIISGVLLCFTSIILSFLGSVKELERKD